MRRSAFILAPNDFGDTPRRRARFNDAVFYSPRRKYLFVSNEKVANSTMRATFQRLEGGGQEPALYHPFKRWTGPLLQPSDVQNFNRVLNDAATFKFCVVRHPLARLISCYRNKFEESARGRGFPKMMRQLGFDPDREEIDFSKFVAAIARQNQKEMNVHWRPQYFNVFMDRIAFSEVIPFENLAESVNAVIKRFYPEAHDASQLVSANRSSTNSEHLIDAYFDAQTKKLAHQIYEIDFDRFGFNRTR